MTTVWQKDRSEEIEQYFYEDEFISKEEYLKRIKLEGYEDYYEEIIKKTSGKHTFDSLYLIQLFDYNCPSCVSGVEKAKQFENCVYFEIIDPEVYGILAYHIANYTGVIKPQVHVSMFQNSVLYIKYPDSLNDISIDFRFFPKCWGTVLETYEISKNIENIIY